MNTNKDNDMPDVIYADRYKNCSHEIGIYFDLPVKYLSESHHKAKLAAVIETYEKLEADLDKIHQAEIRKVLDKLTAKLRKTTLGYQSNSTMIFRDDVEHVINSIRKEYEE